MKRFLLLFLALLLLAGCGPEVAEKPRTKRIELTRTTPFADPGTKSLTLTDQGQVLLFTQTLEGITYRDPQNRYDTPSNSTTMTRDLIEIYEGDQLLQTYCILECAYIGSNAEGPWNILSDESRKALWDLLHQTLPFEGERPPYGAFMDYLEESNISAVRVHRDTDTGPQDITVYDAQIIAQFEALLDASAFLDPTGGTDAIPNLDGAAFCQISLTRKGVFIEDFYISGPYVGPNPGGPFRVLTEESQQALEALVDSLFA